MIDLWVPDKKLHLPTPHAEEFGKTGLLCGTIELGAWDRRHRIVQQFREPSRSPVRAFLDILLAQFLQNAISSTDTGGTVRSYSTYASAYATNAGSVGTWGVVVGTGTTAVDITDTKLATKILVTIATVDATSSLFVIYRNFSNNSGGSITVGETAIYCTTNAWIFCLFRDVPTSLAVPDGGGCYVKYTLKITE